MPKSKILCSVGRTETYYTREQKGNQPFPNSDTRWATIHFPDERDRWSESRIFNVSYRQGFNAGFGAGFDSYEEAKTACLKYVETGKRTYRD